MSRREPMWRRAACGPIAEPAAPVSGSLQSGSSEAAELTGFSLVDVCVVLHTAFAARL